MNILKKIIERRQLINLLSFMVLIFILPFSHTISLRLFVIFIPALLWLLELIAKFAAKDNNLTTGFKIKRTDIDLPVAFLLIWGLLSTILSVDFRYSLKEYRSDMLIGFVLLYSSINNVEKNMVKWIIDALIIGAAVVSIYGILEYMDMIVQHIKSPGRADSVTPDYNYLSVYLILALPIVLYRLQIANNKIAALFFLIAFFLISITLVLTFSRAALIVALFELLLFGVLIDRRLLIILSVVAIIGFVALSLKVRVPLINLESLKANISHPSFTYTDRIDLWRFGIIHLKDRPILGFGYGRANFAKAYPEFFERSRLLFHTHNIFFNIGLELGIPGLIALIWLFWAILKSLWKDWKDKLNEMRLLSFAIFVSVAGFLIRVQFDHLLVDEMALMLWLLVGIGFAISKRPVYRQAGRKQ